jgi:hypothetical protein
MPLLKPARIMIACASSLMAFKLFHHGAPGTLLFSAVIPLA